MKKLLVMSLSLFCLNVFANNCKIDGCPDGYFCGPFMAGRFTCFKDHRELENILKFTVISTTTGPVWSGCALGDENALDAKAAKNPSCIGQVKRISDYKTTAQVQGGKFVCTLSADYECEER